MHHEASYRFAGNRAIAMSFAFAVLAATALPGCTASHREQPSVVIQAGGRDKGADHKDIASPSGDRVVVRVNKGKATVEVNGAVVASASAPEATTDAEVIIEFKPDGTTTVTANGVRVAEVKE